MPIVSHLRDHKLFLDTHIWLALVGGNSLFISPPFVKAVDHAVKNERVLVAPISIWEIGMLVQKKRITLDKDPLDWIEQSLYEYGIKLIPFTPKIAIESTRLIQLEHADPADRILIASAKEENAVLITCDEKILKYAQESFITCHDPR